MLVLFFFRLVFVKIIDAVDCAEKSIGLRGGVAADFDRFAEEGSATVWAGASGQTLASVSAADHLAESVVESLVLLWVDFKILGIKPVYRRLEGFERG